MLLDPVAAHDEAVPEIEIDDESSRRVGDDERTIDLDLDPVSAGFAEFDAGIGVGGQDLAVRERHRRSVDVDDDADRFVGALGQRRVAQSRGLAAAKREQVERSVGFRDRHPAVFVPLVGLVLLLIVRVLELRLDAHDEDIDPLHEIEREWRVGEEDLNSSGVRRCHGVARPAAREQRERGEKWRDGADQRRTHGGSFSGGHKGPANHAPRRDLARECRAAIDP